MKRILTYQTGECGGMQIADYLRARGYSHRVLTHLKHTPAGIQRNGGPAKLYEKLNAGDVLTVSIVEEASSAHIAPVPMRFTIVYEDEDLLVIDKPADMPIHPSVNNYDNTLANGLAFYYRERGQAFVYRCITRLDRDTSGLLLIAKHMLSAAILSELGKQRGIRREYLAIAAGRVPDEGTIDAPIARKEGSVLERCVDFARGERAVTHYRRIDFENGYSLVRLRLETGRTHQIRVHMKYLGYPLIGDFLYNPDYRVMRRQALHSCSLSFLHPITGEQMEFASQPPWEWPCA